MKCFTKHILSLLLLCAAIVLPAACGIVEDGSMCVQYAVVPKPVTKAGEALPDTLTGGMKAYLFIDGRFSRTVEPERDGRYLVSFDGRGKASVVFFAARKADTTTVRTPAEGERMEAAAVKAGGLARAGAQAQDSLSGIYYGRYDYESAAGDGNIQISVPVSNRCARIRVVLKRVAEYYGKADGYTLSISGLRGSLTYDGTVTGDSVVYNPPATFDAEGRLCTAPLTVLPNATGEHVTLTLYKDGRILWQSGVDQDRKPVTLNAGDDVVMIADVERNDMFIQVMTWQQYKQDTVIY